MRVSPSSSSGHVDCALAVLTLAMLMPYAGNAQAAPGAAAMPSQSKPDLSQKDADLASQAALFDRIRTGYYHPGKIVLGCDAVVDYSAALAQIGDPETAKALDGLKLHVIASDSKYAEIAFTWPASVPPESRVPVEQGAKQVIGGFFQAYWPIVNAEVLPKATDKPTVVGAAAGGYTITAGSGVTASRLSIDSNGLIRRVENHPSGQDAVLTLSFTASPKPHAGDQMRFTGIRVDRTVGTSRIQAVMSWDEQEVAGVFVPHRVTVGIPGVFSVPVTFSNCTVAPDPAAIVPAK